MNNNELNNPNIPIIGRTALVSIDDWVVVTSYVKTYIAKPTGGIKAMVESIEDGKIVRFDDALSYNTPLRPVQGPQPGQIGFTKDNIVSAVDATVTEMPLNIVVVTDFYCIKDLQEVSKVPYKTFVEGTLTNRKMMRERSSEANPRRE